MAAHKHWRVNFQSTAGGGVYIEIKECALLDGSLIDLSVGGAARAKTVLGSSNAAEKAFDKDLGTSWQSTAYQFPEWLAYRHPSPVEPAYVSLDLSNTAGYVPSGAITTSWSDDGLAWSGESPDMAIHSGSLTPGTKIQLVVAGPWDAPIPFNVKLSGPLLVPTGLQQPVAGPLLVGVTNVGEYFHGGRGRVYGTVKQKTDPSNTPLRRQVILHRHPDGMAIRSTWSNAATGEFSFERLSLDYRYYAVAFDYARNFRGVVADNLTPEVMA